MPMVECQYCGEYLEEKPEKLEARCPRCREPLFERGGGPRLAAEQRPDDDRGVCTFHAANAAVGTCQRCGNFLCRVCRTRWDDRSMCLACIERVLQDKERSPEAARVHRRQAVLALIFGLIAWGMIVGGGALVLAAVVSGTGAGASLAVLGALLFLGSPLPATFGVGQGVTAVRARGDRLIIATCGLVLSALHLGVMSGLLLLAQWRQ
jgi:hypothetical protein